MDDRASGVVNWDIDAVSDTDKGDPIVSTFSEDALEAARCELGGDCASSVSQALLSLRKRILSQGPLSQLQVATSSLFPLIIRLCVESAALCVRRRLAECCVR